ncbi:trypsin-like peptidase domain-containing protein [Planctomycetota bacterium]
MKNKPEITISNVFHLGSTCPFCQETIGEGQPIVICPDCSCAQHDLCWDHNKGCSSYHCDPKVTSDRVGAEADVVISTTDVSNIAVPSRLKPRSPQDVAKDFLPEKAERRSRLSFIALAVSLCSCAGFAGIFMEQFLFLLLGVVVCIAALILGVIALVRINMNQKISGSIPAGTALMISCGLLVLYIAFMHNITRWTFEEQRVELNLSERPSEEQLENLDKGKADALRANAVVKCRRKNNFIGGMNFGAGIITKLENNRAFILTNKHVVGMDTKSSKKNDNEITVVFYNGEESSAQIKWLAPSDIDIAIISCEVMTMDKYNEIRMNDKVLAPGVKVFAVGNPMNLFWSYTEGVISSMRSRDSGTFTLEVYQTQTPINQGNSGGGLYTMDGLLAGVNTWTLNKSMTEGLNFAISLNSIVEILGDKAEKYMHVNKEKN